MSRKLTKATEVEKIALEKNLMLRQEGNNILSHMRTATHID